MRLRPKQLIAIGTVKKLALWLSVHPSCASVPVLPNGKGFKKNRSRKKTFIEMDIEQLRNYCISKPDTEESFPFDPDTKRIQPWRIRKKFHTGRFH